MTSGLPSSPAPLLCSFLVGAVPTALTTLHRCERSCYRSHGESGVLTPLSGGGFKAPGVDSWVELPGLALWASVCPSQALRSRNRWQTVSNLPSGRGGGVQIVVSICVGGSLTLTNTTMCISDG
jgi:hypothetical protein